MSGTGLGLALLTMGLGLLERERSSGSILDPVKFIFNGGLHQLEGLVDALLELSAQGKR